MDKTVFTGYNEDTYLLIYTDPDKRWIHGKPDEIADLLGEQDAAIAVLEEKREKYARIKEGMMRDLLTGKVRMKGE